MKFARKTTRRDFGRILGALGLLGTAPIAALAGDGVPALADAQAGAGDGPSPAVEALTAYVLARYGSSIEHADRDRLRSEIADGLKAGEALRRITLTNAAEPDLTLRGGSWGGRGLARVVRRR
jgi:hypothetical protein